MQKRILWFMVLGVFVVYANQPSFDCSKVKKDTSEGIICDSDTLMTLDREMASIYKKSLPKASKEDMLKATQRGWIKGRNDCWKAEAEVKCMEESYHSRINELKQKYDVSTTSKQENKAYSFEKKLTLQGIDFHITTTGEGSLRQLTLTPSGLELDNTIMKQEIDGEVVNVEVADINSDGSPEIYIFVTSAGSGAYGSLIAYSVNNKKSMTSIYLSPIEEDKKNGIGYMGHDEFAIIENTLVRHFPIYNKDDANCCPKGGTRQLQYILVMGEASWQLKLVNSTGD